MRRFALAAAIGIVLIGLAILQFRWLGDVSAAERERMRASLQSRSSEVAQAFDGELTRVFVAFHVDGERLDADMVSAIGDAYARWAESAPHPSVVLAVDVVDPNNVETVRRFDPATRLLSTARWPDALTAWLARVRRGAPQGSREPSPLLLADAVDPSIPALVVVVPTFHESTDGGVLHLVADPATVARAIVVELDARVLRDDLLAPLVTRYFGERSDAIVTVVQRADPSRIVFTSDTARPLAEATADVATDLFDLRLDDLDRMFAAEHVEGRGKMAITIVRRAAGVPNRERLRSTGMPPGAWRLLARYRGDSLDALVAA